MHLFSRKPKRTTAISLDIGTEFVKVLVFEVIEEHAVVIGSSKERQRLSDMQGGTVTDIDGVIVTASKAISRACKEAAVEPEQAIIGIAGELVKGNTTVTTITRKHPQQKISAHDGNDVLHSFYLYFGTYHERQLNCNWRGSRGNKFPKNIFSVTIGGYNDDRII